MVWWAERSLSLLHMYMHVRAQSCMRLQYQIAWRHPWMCVGWVWLSWLNWKLNGGRKKEGGKASKRQLDRHQPGML